MLATREDGRRIRSERTRQRIMDSLLELIAEGSLRPRAEEIAGRAGTTTRTIFRHFADIDDLYQEARRAIDLMVEERAGASVDVSGTFADRAKSLAREQGRQYELLRPYLLFDIAHANGVEDALRPQIVRIQGQRLKLWTALPECASAPPNARRGIEQLFSFQCWDQLHREQRLSISETVETIAQGAAMFIAIDTKETAAAGE